MHLTDKLETLYLTHREDWRSWLQKNFRIKKEIWLVFPHKSSGRLRISYNDAVEEALCFGWIDSTVKPLDESSHIQRFSPRRAKSHFSQPNRERLRWLIKKNLLHPSVQEEVKEILKNKFLFPPDILEAIRKHKSAWENYQRFSPAYRRIRVAYIEAARSHPEEFKKRLANFIRKTEENKQIGYGGIEKYYWFLKDIMPKYISLLRGINVGGQKKIKMEELRRLYKSLGFSNVKTYIQIGNAPFSSSSPVRILNSWMSLSHFL